MNRSFFFIAATLLFTNLATAQSVGPFAPSSVDLSFSSRTLTYPEGKVELENSYSLIQSEYYFNINYAQVNNRKIAIDLELLKEIEFLSQFKHIHHQSIQYKDREVLAYLKFKGLDTTRFELELLQPKIDNLKSIQVRTAERLKEIERSLKSNIALPTISHFEIRKACPMDAATAYNENNGQLGLRYAFPRTSLCISKKFGLAEDAADQLALLVQEDFIVNDLQPHMANKLANLLAKRSELRPDATSLGIREANQKFLNRYEVRGHLVTKIFKVVNENVAINDDSLIKDVSSSTSRSPAIDGAKAE